MALGTELMRHRLASLSRLMIAIGGIGLAIATMISLGSGNGDPSLGIILVAGSTAGVAAVRMSLSVDRLRTDQTHLRMSQMAKTALRSIVEAVLILGLGDLAFLCTFGFFTGGWPWNRSFWPNRYSEFSIAYLIPLSSATSVALAVSYLTRRSFRCRDQGRRRPFLLMVPFTMVGLLLLGDLACARFRYRMEQADWHAFKAGDFGGKWSFGKNLPPLPRQPGWEPQPKLVEYHLRMKEMWETGALRPWMPVEADSPSPVP